ncbi:TetR family transcriptional regulator C-terminal domain-containing protein [Akkermansiaceae bacterium]|nr:TetR family transcriptional regulator C-terminal domain-containing protein [Akkermansiaceae bacterium]
MSAPDTKERMLDAAEGIMWTRGFHASGLNEILGAVGVPKGSFYHWFKSKEDFGVEMLRHYIAKGTGEKSALLLESDVNPSPVARILGMLGDGIVEFEEKGHKCPCLVLKLAFEVADLSEPMREVLARGMEKWLEILSTAFRQARELGELSSGTDPVAEAKLVRDLWAGAVQRATIMKSSEPMVTALAHIRSRLTRV